MNSWFEYRPTLEIVQLLAKIERFQGNWEKNTRLKPAVINSLMNTTIVTSSGSSTRIEGALLTDEEIEDIINKGCKITNLSSRSEREVVGYVKALNYIYEYSKEISISEKTIRELHQLLTSELLEDQLPKKQRGAYKDVPNDVIERNIDTGKERVWFQTTPPGIQTEIAMKKLFESFHEASDQNMMPLLRIAIFIVRFLAIHPFRDGNGRLSRLLTVLLLSKEYAWCRFVSHEKHIEDNKEAYYVSLRNTQETFSRAIENYDPWITFFLKIIYKQIIFLKEQIEKTTIKQRKKIKLNENESKVYSYLKKNGESFSSDIIKEVDISKDGLKKLLKRLTFKGVLEKVGAGPATKYKAIEMM